MRTLSSATPDEETYDLGGQPRNRMIDARIQQFLIDRPSGSIQRIATGTGIPTSTVWHALTTRLGYVWRKCRLVPHLLSKTKRKERFQRSQVLLIALHLAKSTAGRFFSTGDESWFFHYTPHRKLWIPPM
jgi:hypothetical protein